MHFSQYFLFYFTKPELQLQKSNQLTSAMAHYIIMFLLYTFLIFWYLQKILHINASRQTRLKTITHEKYVKIIAYTTLTHTHTFRLP